MLKEFELQFFADENSPAGGTPAGGTPAGGTPAGDEETKGTGSLVIDGSDVDKPDEGTPESEGNSTSKDEQGKPEGEEGKPEGKEEDKPEGAPEKYEEFTLPEDFKADQASTDEFSTIAKELNLSQDQAQKLVDMYGEKIKAQNTKFQESAVQRLVEVKEGWDKDLKGDWGGDYTENCGYVRKAIEGASPEFVALLTGQDEKFPGVVMADHPAVAKFLANVGKHMGETSLATGTLAHSKQSRSEILYGSVDKSKGE